MANEATVQVSLQISKGNIRFRSPLTSFKATVAGTRGPTPGAVAVALPPGTDVTLSELLALGGLCEICNNDSTNYVTFGIYDGVKFHPLGEVLPGEVYVLRLSRKLGNQYGAGSGTVGSGDKLRFRADTAIVQTTINAFDA